MRNSTSYFYCALLTLFLVVIQAFSTPSWADELTVSSGTTENEYHPIYGYYCDDVSHHNQVLYSVSELSAMSSMADMQITKLTFYSASTSSSWGTALRVTVGLAEVTETALSGFNSASLTTVYSGAVSVSEGKMVIEFSEPFDYNGGNLLYDLKVTTTGTYQHIKFYGIGTYDYVYSYKRDGDGSRSSYFVPKTTFTYEAASSCKKPSALTLDAVTATSATFSWTAGASETSWQYICLPAATAVDWNSANVQTTSTPSASVSGLNANTDYKFYVRADCGSEQSAEVVNAFATPCSSTDVGSGWSESFETTTAGSGNLPDCWSSVTYTYSNVVYPYVIASNASDGSKSLCFYGGTSSNTLYAILPPFVQDIKNLTISFDYKNGSSGSSWYPQQFSVGYVTNPNDMSTYTNIQTFAQSDSYVSTDEVVFPSSVPTTATNIVIRYAGNQTYDLTSYIDNIQVSVQSSCAKPTGLIVTPASATSANVSWTAGGSETAWNLQYRVKGTSAWTAVNNISSNPYTLIGLSSSTTYEIQVQANCGGEQSSWTSSVEVHTPCAAITSFPWTANFTGMEEYIIPECWDNSASTTTTIGTYPYYVWGTIEKSSNMMLQLYNGMVQSGTAVINTPLFTLPNANDFQFLFDYSHRANCGAFKVKMSVDGAPFADLGTYTNEAGTTATYPGEFTSVTIDLSSYNLANKTIQFQFYANANYGSGGIYIDNIKVRKAPTCITPSGLTISGVTSATADLAWTAGASETNWKVQYKASGASAWTDKAVSGTPSCTLTGLNPTTTYYVQVIADCGAGDYSEPTAQSSFTTTCAPEAMPFEEEFSSSTMPACWEMTAPNTTNKWYMDYQYVSGAYNYYVRLRTGTSGTATLQMPPIALTENAVLKFKWKSASSPVAAVSLYISTDGGTTKTEILNDLSNTHSDWTDKTYDLSAYTGNIVLIYFISTFSSTIGANKYAYLDDVQVIDKPCDLLTNVKAIPTVDGGTISWTGEAKKLQYRAGTSGAWTSVTITDANKANPHTLTGLTSATAYQVRVLSICGDESEEEDWTAPVSFTTKCAPSSVLPYENNFESETTGNLPDCWHKVTTSDDYPQVINGAWAYGGNGNFLEFYGTEDQIAVLPAFTAPLNTLTIQFYYRNHYADFQFGYVKADGVTFVALETLTQNASYGETPHEIDLASISSEAVYLAFRQTNATSVSAAACVDNLVVKETPTCSKPVSLAVSAITSAGATFNWAASAAGETQYQYCVVAKDATAEGWILLGENVRTVTVTGKTAHTEYDFHVRSYCSAGEQSESAKISFQTACAVLSALPWEHDFESDVTWDAPSCWDAIDNSGTSFVYSTNGHNAAQCLYMAYGRTTNPQTIILPKFSTALGSLYISFWYKGSEDTSTKTYGKVQVGYITDITDENSFVAVGDPFAPTSTYQNAQVPFIGVSADARIALRYTGGTSDGELYIDDIRVAVIQACVRPTDVNAVAVSGGANITWTDDAASEWSLRYSVKDEDNWTTVNNISAQNYSVSGLANGTEYKVQVKAVCSAVSESDWSEAAFFTPFCTVPTDLTVVSTTKNSARLTWVSDEASWNIQYKASADAVWTSVDNITVKDYTISGLTAGTTYQVKVQSNCGGAFTSAVSFTTKCNESDELPYTIDFESATTGVLPACWDKVSSTEYPQVISGGAAYGGDGKALCFFGASDQTVVLPGFTSAISNLSISFFYKNNNSTIEIGYVEDDFVTYHKLADLANTSAYDENVYELSLESAPAEAANIAIRFVGTDGFTSWSYFDNMTVRYTPTCKKPTDLTAPTANINSNSAQLSWTETGTATKWNIQYQLAPATDWTAATTVAVTTNPYTLTGLAEGTSYVARVQADCGAGDENKSDWSDETTFTTHCAAITAIPFTEDFNADLNHCWHIASENPTTYAAYVSGGKLVLPGGKEGAGHVVVMPEISADLSNATFSIRYSIASDAETPEVGYIITPGDVTSFVALETLSKSATIARIALNTLPVEAKNLAIRYDGTGSIERDFSVDEIRISHVEVFADDASITDNSSRLTALAGGTMDVILERSLARTGNYASLSLPFALSAEQLADTKCPLNGFVVREYDHAEVDRTADIVDIYLRTVNAVEAGKAYFVRYDGTADALQPMEFRDVTVAGSTIVPTEDGGTLTLYPVFDPFHLEANNEATLYLSTNNLLYYPTAEGYIKGFRAYFNVPAGSSMMPVIRRGAVVRISEGHSTPTELRNVQTTGNNVLKRIENNQVIIIRNGVKYTIQGQKIQ